MKEKITQVPEAASSCNDLTRPGLKEKDTAKEEVTDWGPQQGTDQAKEEATGGALVPAGECGKLVRVKSPPLDADHIPITPSLMEAVKVKPIQADPADPDKVGRAVRQYQTLSLGREGLAKASFRKGMRHAGRAVAYAREAGVILLVEEKLLGEGYPAWCKKHRIDYTWQNRAKGYAKYLQADETLIAVHKANALVGERRRLEYRAAATPSSDPPEATPEVKAPAKSSGKSEGGKATSGPKLTKTGGIATGRRGRPVNANPKPKRWAKGMQMLGEAIEGGEVKDREILQCLAWLANRLSDDKLLLAVLGKDVAAYVKEVRGPLDAIGKLLPPRR
jgi:hypothetical protein